MCAGGGGGKCSDRAHGIIYFGYWLGTVDKYGAQKSL